MKIRRFYGKNMRSALRQVTAEFGDDAAILSNQKTASGVEVIAALDYDQDLLPSSPAEIKTQPEIAPTQNIGRVNTPVENAVIKNAVVKNTGQQSSIFSTPKDSQSPNNSAELVGQQRVAEQKNVADQISQVMKNIPTQSEPAGIINSVEWSTDPGLVAMREELSLMRSMMSEQLKGIGWERFSEKDPTRAMLSRRFSTLGINQSIANRLIPQVNKQQDAECCWQNLLALLAKSISINSKALLTHGGVFAFMGPSGAGKTTTIAKLAARYVIKHGVDSVALISTDNYRISAQQHLGSFARLLGIPMLCVSAKHSLDNLLTQTRSKKLVLIDTAGMSRKDADIAAQLKILKQSSHEIKRFLLIPATNQSAVVKQSIDLFQPYAPYAVIISKLDEAASLGEVLSLVIENMLPVAFTTDGQRVPEDIRVARNHHLVSKAVWLTNKYGTRPQDWQLAQEVPQVRYA